MDNRVIEIFGRHTDLPCPSESPWSDLRTETSSQPYRAVTCPFRAQLAQMYAHTETNTCCDKIRKARPNPLIGNCIVRKTSHSLIKDWIVCPSRFVQNKTIFEDLRKFIPGEGNFEIVKEVGVNEGTLDYVLARTEQDDDGINLADFVAIEIQACGTGGSGPIWDARNDYLANSLRKDYSFSLNEKDASKKILVQLLHKARQVARWRKNTVLVIQDHFLEHLRNSYNIDAHFHDQDDQDFIHIHAYEAVNNGNNFEIKLKTALSTDMVGLSMALISNPASGYLPYSAIEEKILHRIEESRAVTL